MKNNQFTLKHLGRSTMAVAVSMCFVSVVQAQEPVAKVQRVEVTGSSIKRIQAEGSLPVQVITAKELAKTGATNVAEVIQNLPAMQGFQIADIAVGSNSGGIVTANIHDIGSSYTLVLLNGRRIAPTGSGSTVNLNSIPMSAIDRIEVLTDGASALYGSDAIAGVVNFVLKQNQQGGNVTGSAMVPLEGGGKSGYVSATYGFGDIDTDRFNVLMSVRHDVQRQLAATERDFGSTAYLPFSHEGKKFIYDRTSAFAVPANASVTFNKPANGAAIPAYSFNPYEKKTGKCAERNFYSLNNASTATSVTQNCAYDFANTIEIYPESKRDSLYLTGRYKAADALTFYSDVAYSRYDLTARIAANPVPVSIPLSSSLYATHVLPNLSATQAANVKSVTANYRAQDFGLRSSQTITDSKHFVVGAEGEYAGWSLNGGMTWSQNAIDEKYVGGYFKDKEFRDMIAKNLFDPFQPAGNQSAETRKLMADSIFHGSVRTASTTLTGFDLRASREIYRLPAGALSLGLGADLRQYEYKNTPSAASVAGEIYNFAAPNQYELKRKSGGVFGELLIPVVKNLEMTAALRYDFIKPVSDLFNKKTVGEDLSSSTYKVSARYQVMPNLLFRGSYGTGFKAPDMLSLAQPLVPNGVTAASFDCPYPGTEFCKPGKLQYSQLSGGNAAIKPEKSKQFAVGFRFEPTSSFGFGADYWNVHITDAISGVSAAQAFADPVTFKNLFTTYKTPAEPQAYYAFKSVSTNIGQSKNSGIDWDFVGRTVLSFGRLTVNLAGTYVIESSYTKPGTKNDFTTSLGYYNDVSASVTFRNKLRFSTSLDTGNFSNTIIVNAVSHYLDKPTAARNVATNGFETVTLPIGNYATLDWQGVYNYSKTMRITLGVKNLLNKEPPLSLRDSSGHQVGYDPRYADPLLRRVYLVGSYDF
jgi:iron complex outermembrane receptor protein